MRRTRISSIVVVTAYLAYSSVTIGATPSQKPTFRIGDPAPAIEQVTWLQGEPVTKFVRGHVYVVEFWATWCPPCLKAIPHLSELQRRYANSVTIIGINAEGLLGNDSARLDTVQHYVSKHAKEMACTVAVENPATRPISERWVAATGSMGAPTAAIVDRRGALVWIGYPDMAKIYPFDQALEDTLAGKVDLVRSKALQRRLSHETAESSAKSSRK
jgi:thiol-disulfide isomerase/thioredoxin